MRKAEFFFYKTFTGLSNAIELLMRFEFSNSFLVKLFDMTCKVFAPDEFRDVTHYLNPFLSSTPAVGLKRSC